MTLTDVSFIFISFLSYHVSSIPTKGGRAGVTTAAAEEGSTDVDATTADEVGRVLAHHLHQVGHIIHVRTMLPQGGMMV